MESAALRIGTDIKPKHPDNVLRKPQVLVQLDIAGVLVNGSVTSRVRPTCDMAVFAKEQIGFSYLHAAGTCISVCRSMLSGRTRPNILSSCPKRPIAHFSPTKSSVSSS